LRFEGFWVLSLSPMRLGCCLLSVLVVVFDFGLFVMSLPSLFGTRLYGSKGSLIFAMFFRRELLVHESVRVDAWFIRRLLMWRLTQDFFCYLVSLPYVGLIDSACCVCFCISSF
jgi:hypothetical protein